MTITGLLPVGVRDYARLIRARHHFPGRRIDSAFVSCEAALGENCTIERDAVVSRGARIGNNTVIYRGAVVGRHVKLGDYSYINEGSLVISGEIGKFSSISPRCNIGLQTHPLTFASTSPSIYGDQNVIGMPPFWGEIGSPPRIGSDVWIGAGAVVLQGVAIGHGAIVGASAVVTHGVPPYAIVTGVPARTIKMRFSDETIQCLLEIGWWDWSVETLRLHADLFCLREPELLGRLRTWDKQTTPSVS